MWYCEMTFVSNEKLRIPFKDQEHANNFFNGIEKISMDLTRTFITAGYYEKKINIRTIETISKPIKMEDTWENEES
uniref:hypothetical protein n=1 Tax=Carnobacterium sp. TaxID=48221 RepID=UPI00344EE6CB